MSCINSTPSASRPCRLSISERDASVRSTHAVLLSVTTAPMTYAPDNPYPNPSAIAPKTSVVTRICPAPPISADPPSPLSLGQENSSPIVNSSSETPSSASTCIPSPSPTIPIACGPSSIPAARYPTIGLCFNREKITPSTIAPLSRIRISRSKPQLFIRFLTRPRAAVYTSYQGSAIVPLPTGEIQEKTTGSIILKYQNTLG